jgi:hypothetical protein
LHDRFARGLDVGVEPLLVDHRAPIIVNDTDAINPDAVDAASVRGPDELIGNVE